MAGKQRFNLSGIKQMGERNAEENKNAAGLWTAAFSLYLMMKPYIST
jgi:hypothetical protein